MKHILLVFLLYLFLPLALNVNVWAASTYIVLWDSSYWSHLDPDRRRYDYVDAFVTLEECRRAKQQRLEDQVWFQVSIEDGIRSDRRKMSQAEIEKYKKEHPDQLDRVVTDGQIKRDSLGLVPIDPEFAQELKQRGAPDLPSGWVGKREWVKKPSYLEIRRNDGKRLVYDWICMPDTIDPRR